jgi:hypothetical protein
MSYYDPYGRPVDQYGRLIQPQLIRPTQTTQPTQPATPTEAERCQSKTNFEKLDIDSLLKLDLPSEVRSTAKLYNKKTQKYKNKCSASYHEQSKGRRKLCDKINTKKAKLGRNLYSQLTRFYKEKIKTRINKAVRNPKEKRIRKLACAISEFLDMFKNGNCSTSNTIKDIPTFTAKFDADLRTKMGTAYQGSSLDYVKNILYSRGDVKETQKQLLKLNPKIIDYLAEFIVNIKECSPAS